MALCLPAIVLFVVYMFFDFIRLLYDGSVRYQIPSHIFAGTDDKTSRDTSTHQIPKIIHQSYFGLENATMSETWQEAQRSIQSHNVDYRYILWNKDMAHDFIAEHYPWFISTYENYPYHIMRIDALRYFILHYYGGIYIDLDYGATESFDRLLQYPVWLRKTTPTGVSNDMMGSIPRHPFFDMLIESLEKYNRNWWFPYLTVMYATGPMFVSMIVQKFKNNLLPESQKIRFIYPNDDGNDIRRIVYRVMGSSWHQNDAKYFLFIRDHGLIIAFVMTLVVGYLYAKRSTRHAMSFKNNRCVRWWKRLMRRSFTQSTCDSSNDSDSDFSDTGLLEKFRSAEEETWMDMA